MNLKFQLLNHGFEIREQACPAPLLQALQSEFPLDTPVDWDLLDHSASVREQATNGEFQALAAAILGPDCFPTHAILYNKNLTAQAWHQDTTIKVEGQGFIEAPNKEVYSDLLSLRLSLDDCGFFDGALKLCPTSHKHGPLTPNEVRAHSSRPFSSPEMRAGDILLMHPLTIHASGANETGRPRRVIHIVYAAAPLRSILRPVSA
ncbi:phytanoyl-CoA dioxygenase family protein [Bryobacter aggregatus]|uniref:phytanoyl-CoA dioxygenase family protein n=1 Tax=Bryobacter aggregatus TaxID=360054 RepID=UPI0004E0E65A|nr:phytanoyl-CoA dioxygenase family protein [Bryobacter aggregatus]